MSPKPERPLRILAIGAHPDDIEFACGGILLVEAARGSEIKLCVCSRGESGSNGTPDERVVEAHCAAELIGAQLEFFDFGGDAHIEPTNQNAIALARHIRTARPDILLSSVVTADQHPDHGVVGALSRDAARFARYGGIAELREIPPHAVAHHFEYAVTPSAEPTKDRPAIRVDISSQFAKWIELMECHGTQLLTRNYIELQTARARLLGAEMGVEYAQAIFSRDHFYVKTLAELPASVRMF